MCSYITLVVHGDTAGVPAVLKRHGRKATAVDNPSLRKLLGKDEAQFLTTAAHCDCGTVLGVGLPVDSDDRNEAERLRRRGWSEAKISRALQDRQKSRNKPSHRPIDSFALWTTVLNDVLALKDIKGAGLIVHQYSGNVADEDVPAQRREIHRNDIEAELALMREDELLFAQGQ